MTRALRHMLFLLLAAALLAPVAGQAASAPAPYYPGYMKRDNASIGTKPPVDNSYVGGNLDATSVMTCVQSHIDYLYTTKIVICIRTYVTLAMVQLMNYFSEYMTWTVGVMMLFATVIFGMRILGGEREIMPKAFGFVLRLALVWVFSYNMGGFPWFAFQTMDTLIAIMLTGVGATGYSPWADIDGFLGILFGMGSSITLVNGLLGIVGAAFFSATTGVFLFMAGFMAIFNLLMFIFRVVFTYLSAVLLLAFLTALSPFIIPLAIFFWTERYFTKWLHMMIYAVMVPVMLFAFLGIFRYIFWDMINDIFVVLGGNDFRTYWRFNVPAFSWLMPADPDYSYSIQEQAGIVGTGTPAVQSNINPLLRRGSDASALNMPGVDFGPNTVGLVQQLTWLFFKIWVIASLFKSLIGKIPEVCNNIAQIGSYLITMQPTQLENRARGMMHKGQQGIMDAVGGGRGGGG